MKIIVLLVALLVCSIGLSSATTITITIDDVDGINDSTVIQNAVNSSSSGDIIFIESGTYNMSAHTLNYNTSNTTIRGNTSSLTKLEWHSAVIFVSDNIYNNLTLRNIWLDGDSVGDTNGVYFGSSDYGLIESIKVTGFSRDGIRLDDSHQCTINNSEITGSGVSNAGIFLVNADHSEISNNVITTGIAHGIDINTGNHNLSINNNTVTGFTGIAGIYLYGGSSSCTVADNLIYGNRDGIRFITGSGWDVNNNIVRNNNRYGIIIEGQYYTKDATFSNNLIYSNSNDGIISTNVASLQNPYTQTFKNNVIYSNGGDGFQNSHPNITFSLSNNIITSNSGYGIKQTSGTVNSNYNDVWDNTLGSYNGTVTGNNNISSNPLFYDLTNFWLNSTAGTWNGTGWEIMSDHSPCIDAGNSSDDYSNEPAPNGSRINMGAYGNTIYASKSNTASGSTTDGIYGNLWSGNVTYDANITLVQCTGNVELQDAIPSFASKWRFDNNSTLDENTTNSNDGTNYGAAYNSNGYYGGAFEFEDISGECIDFGHSDSFNSTDLTICLYINFKGRSDHDRIISKKSKVAETPVQWALSLDETALAGNDELLWSYHNIGWIYIRTEGANLENNQWYHIAATRDGNILKVYLNGKLLNINASAGNAEPLFGTDTIRVGSNGFNNLNLNASVDDVRIYNCVLTNNEINQTRDNHHKTIGSLTRNYTSFIGVGEELKTLSYTGTGNNDINASVNNSIYNSIQINASSGTNYDVSENGYKYGRFVLHTNNLSTTPVLYNITGTYGAAEETTIETFVVAVGAFAAVIIAGAAVVSRRVRVSISGWINRRRRRR